MPVASAVNGLDFGVGGKRLSPKIVARFVVPVVNTETVQPGNEPSTRVAEICPPVFTRVLPCIAKIVIRCIQTCLAIVVDG